jgi:hypothetical protein
MTRPQELAENRQDLLDPALDVLTKQIEIDERRSAYEKLAVTFGGIGFFGVVDFITAFLRGTVSPIRFVSLVSAICLSVSAVLAWRARRDDTGP